MSQELSKGLQNRAGENNCFLNVVIQSLWHVDSFRRRFGMWTDKQHHHTGNVSCVFCALGSVFTQYAFSDDAFIPPSALRTALHVIYSSQQVCFLLFLKFLFFYIFIFFIFYFLFLFYFYFILFYFILFYFIL